MVYEEDCALLDVGRDCAVDHGRDQVANCPPPLTTEVFLFVTRLNKSFYLINNVRVHIYRAETKIRFAGEIFLGQSQGFWEKV